MTAKHSTCALPRILVVTAIYNQSPSETRALTALLEIRRSDPEMLSHFSLLVYDNSPEVHEVPADFPSGYVHDPTNRGLAAAYNYGLARAAEGGFDWLLLLDQDTTPTSTFLRELVSSLNTLRREDNVVAVVPKLIVRGVIQSPGEHFIDYIRHQFSSHSKTFSRASGTQPGRISAYNSGSSLNVQALQAIGGFPQEFWLDYLDHAVFHALCKGGGKVYILQSVLMHDLAESDLNARPIWRFRNVLKAQALFVRRAGNITDQILYRVWLLRGIRRLRADVTDKRVWRETASQALLVYKQKSLKPVRPQVDSPAPN